MMMQVGRLHLADTLLVSTVNSWRESRPGWRYVIRAPLPVPEPSA